MGWKSNLRAVSGSADRLPSSPTGEGIALGRNLEPWESKEELIESKSLVHDYKKYIERLHSLHLHEPTPIDWESLAKQAAPEKPDLTAIRTQLAKKQLADFKPTATQKMLGIDVRTRSRLQAFLDSAIKLEKSELKAKLERFQADRARWKSMVSLATAVNRQDMEAYLLAAEHFPIFESILRLGSSITLSTENQYSIIADFAVYGKEIIPDEKYSLLDNGKLSGYPIGKTEYQDIYQRYVCSALFRIARELFALLPVEEVKLTAFDEIIESSNGHPRHAAIVSSVIDRNTFLALNFDLVDPTNALVKFPTNMDFKSRVGFSAVELIA